MIELTERASGVLLETLKEAGVGEDRAFRIRIEGSTPRIDIGERQPGDRAVEERGSTLLLVDPEADRMYGHSVVDIKDTDEGPALIMRNTPE